MYDIIGDIHGQYDKLVHLLTKMGYQRGEQGYHHPERKAIFVGDLIDRGPKQLELLKLVRTMQENDNALIVMGNHEFNAIGWHTEKSDGSGFLRAHNERHFKQHHQFLSQIIENSLEHEYWINWMKSLPLFLDLGTIRIVHACWNSVIINKLKGYLTKDNQLKSEYWSMAFNPRHPLMKLCEVTLKGEDIHLPNNLTYQDKEGNVRRKMRIRWWIKHAKTWYDLLVNCPESLKNELQHEIEFDVHGYQEMTPVIFGHYWFSGQPKILSPKLACVDYSAALPELPLVAYRFSGESLLDNKHFIC